MTDSNFKKACVIGHPIKHSRSPIIHNYWIKKYGLLGEYSREDIHPEDMKQWFSEFSSKGFSGFNVTLPHKETAFHKVDILDETAKAVEAVNTVWMEKGLIHGTNTDVYGYLAHLDASCPQWENTVKHVVVLGAGGAARGIVYGFVSRGIEKVTVVNRTQDKAEKLAGIFSHHPNEMKADRWSNLSPLLEEADLLVNTTALGMTGSSPLEVNLEPMKQSTIVSDIVYAPLETDLLRQAKARNLRVVDGLGMLLHQAVPGFEKWFGIRPEVDSTLYNLIVADLNR